MRRVAVAAAVLIAVGALFTVTTAASTHKRPAYLVRAIFDDASFAVAGEDVRVAGANVGTIQSLGVTDAKRAAVTLAISDLRFAPFHADATCAIRPQSLIGEQYVDCNPGTSNTQPLPKITHGPGTGSHYLPVTRTSSPIDSDIVQNISTEPVRQSLAVIIDEFGTGLAARGSDLNAVIHRANPALGDTDRVIKILAQQNHTLAQLATDSDTVLAPLARERSHLAGFVTQANTTAVASAQRAADIQKTFQEFPSFLRQLRPLMADLGTLADQGTPLMTSLGQSASAVGQQFANLTPFAAAARKALIDLGASAQKSQPALVATLPLAQRLKKLGSTAVPSAALLDRLTASIQKTGGIQQLMNLLFNGAVAGNGFNSLGHYVRAEPLVSDCTDYVTRPAPGCSSNFSAASASASAADAQPPDQLVTKAVRKARPDSKPSTVLQGLMTYLTGSGR
jgi:phospholipid/cholesterol/gamma-HCH transport system substrate-binding protein